MDDINKLKLFDWDELSYSELTRANGGAPPILPIGFAVWLGNEIIQNWSDIKKGISDGTRDGKRALNIN